MALSHTDTGMQAHRTQQPVAVTFASSSIVMAAPMSDVSVGAGGKLVGIARAQQRSVTTPSLHTPLHASPRFCGPAYAPSNTHYSVLDRTTGAASYTQMASQASAFWIGGAANSQLSAATLDPSILSPAAIFRPQSYQLNTDTPQYLLISKPVSYPTLALGWPGLPRQYQVALPAGVVNTGSPQPQFATFLRQQPDPPPVYVQPVVEGAAAVSVAACQILPQKKTEAGRRLKPIQPAPCATSTICTTCTTCTTPHSAPPLVSVTVPPPSPLVPSYTSEMAPLVATAVSSSTALLEAPFTALPVANQQYALQYYMPAVPAMQPLYLTEAAQPFIVQQHQHSLPPSTPYVIAAQPTFHPNFNAPSSTLYVPSNDASNVADMAANTVHLPSVQVDNIVTKQCMDTTQPSMQDLVQIAADSYSDSVVTDVESTHHSDTAQLLHGHQQKAAAVADTSHLTWQQPEHVSERTRSDGAEILKHAEQQQESSGNDNCGEDGAGALGMLADCASRLVSVIDSEGLALICRAIDTDGERLVSGGAQVSNQQVSVESPHCLQHLLAAVCTVLQQHSTQSPLAVLCSAAESLGRHMTGACREPVPAGVSVLSRYSSELAGRQASRWISERCTHKCGENGGGDNTSVERSHGCQDDTVAGGERATDYCDIDSALSIQRLRSDLRQLQRVYRRHCQLSGLPLVTDRWIVGERRRRVRPAVRAARITRPAVARDGDGRLHKKSRLATNSEVFSYKKRELMTDSDTDSKGSLSETPLSQRIFVTQTPSGLSRYRQKPKLKAALIVSDVVERGANGTSRPADTDSRLDTLMRAAHVMVAGGGCVRRCRVRPSTVDNDMYRLCGLTDDDCDEDETLQYSADYLVEHTVPEVRADVTCELAPGTRVIVCVDKSAQRFMFGTVDVRPCDSPVDAVCVRLIDGRVVCVSVSDICLLPAHFSSWPTIQEAETWHPTTSRHNSCSDESSNLSDCKLEIDETMVDVPEITPHQDVTDGVGEVQKMDTDLTWCWMDKGTIKPSYRGLPRRREHMCVRRGNEHVQVGDCVVFTTLDGDLPYVGRVQHFWETFSGKMMLKVAWFYHPQETKADCSDMPVTMGALFESSHRDQNYVQTISHRCEVLSVSEYETVRPTKLQQIRDHRIFYNAGFYDPKTYRIRFNS